MPFLIILIVALLITIAFRESYWSNKLADYKREPVKIREVHANFEEITYSCILPEEEIKSMPQEVVLRKAKEELFRKLGYYTESKFEKDVNPNNWRLTLKILVGTKRRD